MNATSQTQPTETVIEYLVVLQGSRGIIRDFDSSGVTIENSVIFQQRMALSWYEHTGLSISEYFILY